MDNRLVAVPKKGAMPAPAGCKWYETTLLLRPDATESEREAELVKVQACLKANGAVQMEVIAREPTPTAYAVKGHTHAAYVLITYAAPPTAVPVLHKLFTTPVVGALPVLLRFMSFAK
jgi:small subunit ribosomal protein S6